MSVNNIVFPIAYAVNFFSITLILILAGLTGQAALAAEIAISHAAVQAVFLAFSSNARNLILSQSDGDAYFSILKIRLLLLIPLSIIAYLLGSGFVDITFNIFLIVLIRRICDWLEEINITIHEVRQEHEYAFRTIFLQTSCIMFLVISLIFKSESLIGLALLLWALCPILFSSGFVIKSIRKSSVGKILSYDFLPHFGSTWVIAISLYAFRLLIFLLVGKEVAGNLFSAFAIGGVMSSLYIHCFAPSLIKNGNRKGIEKYEFLVTISILVLSLAVFTILNSLMQELEDGQIIFWNTVCLSLIGSLVMLFAQKKRTVLLQIDKANVFIPDMFSNIVLIISVPFFYYSIGPESLQGMFLWSSILCLIVYVFPNLNLYNLDIIKTVPLVGSLQKIESGRQYLQAISIVMLVTPVFIQLSSENLIFSAPDIIYEHGGNLLNLPLPISLASCFICMFFLLKYEKCVFSANIIFFTFLLMLFSTVIIANGEKTTELGKFMLLVQFILPMFGLFLGQSYFEPSKKSLKFENIIFLLVIVIISLQVFMTILKGTVLLTPDMTLFSIYQHLQYVPVMLIALLILSAQESKLLENNKLFMVYLIVISTVYLCMSLSHTAILLGLTWCLWSMYYWISEKKTQLAFSFVLTLLMSLVVVYFFMFMDIFGMRSNDSLVAYELISPSRNLASLTERIEIWDYFLEHMKSSHSTFLFGSTFLSREGAYHSAHNFYIDLVFNFGIISLLPILILIAYIVYQAISHFHSLKQDKSLLIFFFVLMYLLLIDNALKVGMRQPYSGIITYFLAGLFLAKIDKYKTHK